MKTLITILAFIAVSLNINAQACQQCRTTAKNVQVGDLEFIIETSYTTTGFAGTYVSAFDRIFFLSSNGEKKELPLPEYRWGATRTIESIELEANSLILNCIGNNERERAVFLPYQGSWSRIVTSERPARHASNEYGNL